MVRLLTRDYGKVTCRAISARKTTSKLAGHLEPFIETQAFFARSKTIDIIAGSNTIFPNARLRQSLSHYAIAGYFVEIVDRSMQDRDSDLAVYEFVRLALVWQNNHDANTLVFVGSVLQLFGLFGYRMGLYNCHNCQKPIQPVGSMFHFQLWNVECADCRSPEETIALSEEVIKILRFLMNSDFDTIARLHVPEKEWLELHVFLRTLLQYHYGSELIAENTFISLLRA